MSLRTRAYDVGVMLGALRAPYNTDSIIKNITVQYILDDFGVIVSVIKPTDYNIILEALKNKYPNYRLIFVTENDDLEEQRYKILWELMRSGYMTWLRLTYGSRFRNILESGNLGNLIIDERLKIWGNQPKYKYLATINREAREMGVFMMLSRDPGFYDYMP